MESINYFVQKKELYDALLAFIEKTGSFDNLKNIINKQCILNNIEELKHFLSLILNISNNHRRDPEFFNAIRQILTNFKNDIKKSMKDLEILQIFISNKIIVLFLLEEQIIEFNGYIIEDIFNYQKEIIPKYSYFFILEIKDFISKNDYFSYLNEKIIENEIEIKNLDETFPEEYCKKRLIGENDSKLCSLIRDDSCDEFIAYINNKKINVSSLIQPSIYETNIFLLEKEETTLIEYAAFYGSNQIFTYLYNSGAKINKNLWEYGIHSNNKEFFHKLKEIFNNPEIFNLTIQDEDQLYKQIYQESIKCHHNEIAQYIEDNFLVHNSYESEKLLNTDENIISTSFKYYNYRYFPSIFNQNIDVYYNLYNYKYFSVLKKLLPIERERIPRLKKKRQSKNQKFLIVRFKKDDQIENLFIVYFLLEKQDQVIDEQFLNCHNIIKLIIPPSIKSIGPSSFCECKSLVQISLPPTLQKICPFAFRFCEKLEQINIPSTVTFIGRFAFEECESLKEIILPTSVNTIEKGAFYKCSSLEKILLSSSIKIIEKNLIAYCSSLKKILIPSSVTTICKGSFKDCKSLNQVIFEQPSSLASIEKSSFVGCSSLEIITIPSSIITIGNDVFNGFVNQNVIFNFPSSLNYIGENNFIGYNDVIMIRKSSNDFSIYNKKSKHLIISNQIAKIDECFAAYRKDINKITLSNSVILIDENAFEECRFLSDIFISSSVFSIGKNAFSGCSFLEEINIPFSVSSIGCCAFNGCTSLKQITIPKRFDLNYIGIANSSHIKIINIGK